ncbi:BTAD domain-containing putative transcriptional regulator [Brevibacillus parabrevis]|jgi:ATP-dependent transcriptional regulator|uniref:BTAD domain-containing putative transcriptional regulator n=1 Tax=Brevibacillus parabrevis TaxID=54914 RepID=UPI002490AE20|nr:BTAD domain-containing putative transcriptional regulator [Brevibacillus parabrevis]
MSQFQVPISKITLPGQKPYVLRRPALARKLRLLAHAQLCLIHAGAGYGKTTSFATFLHDESRNASWYFIAEEDTALADFLWCLVESVRRVAPDFGQTLRELLEKEKEAKSAAAFAKAAQGENGKRFADWFARECARLPDQFVIVLDRYERVAGDSEIDRFVSELVQHVPHKVKLAILTRIRPVWKNLELLTARGECLELTTDDLAFTIEESEAFYSDQYDIALTEDEWQQVAEVTRGWVMALRSIGEKIARGFKLSDSLHELSRLLHLLEADVWVGLKEDMQHFLMEAAALETFTEEDGRQVLGAKAGEMLQEAKRSNLFLHVDERERYFFHPLFQRLLSGKLASHQDIYTRVNQAAALWFRRKGEEEQAFERLRLLERWDLLGSWVRQAAERFLSAGVLDGLYKWLALLPDSVKAEEHWLWFYQGEVERYRCLYAKAFASYEQFLVFCEQKQDRIGLCRGLEGKARVHLDSVQGVQAEALLMRAIEQLPVQEQESELAPRLYRLLAEIYTNRGDSRQAAAWYEKSQELEQQTEVELESRLLFRTGRLQSSIQLLETKWQLEQTRHPTLTRSYRETSLLLSFVYALDGEWERGFEAAETAIQLGRAAHSPFVEANGYVRKAHAALISQGLPADEIRKLYEKGLHMMEELQSTRGKSETLLGLTLYHASQKALDQALLYGKRGIAETEAMRDDWLGSLVRMAIGIAYAKYGKDAEALETFRDCSERLSHCGDSYHVAICQLWLSFLAYRSKRWELFVPAVTQALSLMQTGEYAFLLQRPTLLTPYDVQQLMPILLEAERRKVSPDYVSQLLNDLGLQNVTFHPGYTLRIQTLGAFRVWLGERELSEKAWQRGTAKLLFQLLLTKRHHLLAREEIMHRLWPDSIEEAAIRDFKVALNALNKALEPDRAARSDTFFIQRHGSSYGFNLASGYLLDVEEFEKLVALGLSEQDVRQATLLLEKGLGYYLGEYLPECRYEEWCVEERERVQALFLRGAERLAKIRLEQGQQEQAIRWCEAILRVDDCWEEAYRLLMTAYYEQNNRTQAIRWYKKCVAKLQEQLGVAPMQATQETYWRIREK